MSEPFIIGDANELLSALEESETLLEQAEAREREALEVLRSSEERLSAAELAKASMQAERDAMKEMHAQAMAEHKQIHEQHQAEISQLRARLSEEQQLRASAEGRLAAELAKPAPKPEQVMVPVEKLVHAPAPTFRMTFKRDKNGRIDGDVLIQPVKE